MKMPLTPKEQAVLKFITGFLEAHGCPPSFEEIRDKFGYKSFHSVQQFLSQLETKGYLRNPGGSKKRAIQLIQDEESKTAIPLIGYVAAGLPIEAIRHHAMVEVASTMLRPRATFFALHVKGDSMIDDGILEDDIVIIKKQPDAENGQTVVALINNEATIKRYYKKKSHIELHSANPKYKPIIVDGDGTFKIEGVLHGLIRRYET